MKSLRAADLLRNLSLEELATLVIAILTEQGGCVLPQNSTKDEAVFIALSSDEAAEAREYWKSVFGDVTAEAAAVMVEEYYRIKALDKMREHAEAYESSEGHERANG